MNKRTDYEMILVKGGKFMMGSKDPEAFKDEQPIHEVELTDFYMGKYPVTNEEYAHFIKVTGYREPKYWGDRNFNQSNQPVVGVSWGDAKAFAAWAGMELPTEARWEYAARSGGEDQKYAGGDDVDKVAWYYSNSINKTHAVGEKEPNGLGLYDMSGNVYEWCEDVYDRDAYEEHNSHNPVIITGGTSQVVRGGGWGDIPKHMRAAFRFGYVPDYCNYDLGFRLCLSQVR